jgi:hypothetical protein
MLKELKDYQIKSWKKMRFSFFLIVLAIYYIHRNEDTLWGVFLFSFVLLTVLFTFEFFVLLVVNKWKKR